MAHVYEYKWVEDKIKYIDELIKDSNLDGIECYYSNFTEKQTAELLQYCKDNNLYTSGGTDYHGTKRPSVEIGIGKGNLKIPDETIKDWYNK